jgi:hypothetical protein
MHLHRVGVVLAFAAVLTVTAYAGQAQDAAAKGAELLAEARKALGGDAQLAAVKGLEAKGTVRRGAGNVNLEGDLEIFIELPGKFRRNEELAVGDGGIERTEGLNGTEAWEEMKFVGGLPAFGGGGDGGGGFAGRQGGGQQTRGQQAGRPAGARGAPPADLQLQARQTEFARVLLAVLLTSDVPVRWIGTAVSPQSTAEVLQMQTPDGTPTRLFIDSKTFMPLMLTWTGVPEDPLAAMAGRAGFNGRGRGGRGGRGGFRGGGGFPGGGGFARGGQGGDAAAAAAPQVPAEPTTLQMFLSDYKTVNGIKLPHLMTRGANDQVTEEWIIKNYRVNPNFKADTFSK